MKKGFQIGEMRKKSMRIGQVFADGYENYTIGFQYIGSVWNRWLPVGGFDGSLYDMAYRKKEEQ